MAMSNVLWPQRATVPSIFILLYQIHRGARNGAPDLVNWGEK
jgi:hypothetical protein